MVSKTAEEDGRFDTMAALVAAYRADLDASRDDAWWGRADYAVKMGHGTAHLQPSRPDVTDDGTAQKSWRVRFDTDEGSLERRFTDDRLPTPAEAERRLAALARQALPSRHPERDRVVARLRELAGERHKIDAEARRIALEAVAHGVKKIAVADAARISRVTLDRWIRGR
ncbi:MAG TPA: hypothetical protein VFQ96_06660 [Microbacteriaceae bacterium]|nr:hypothetical protein [Microbacteriaceae bacterium]